MKAAKKITVILLCIAIIIVSAATGTYAYETPYSGILAEGENLIPTDEYSYDFWFDFYADESGYYSISSMQADLDIFVAETDDQVDKRYFVNEKSESVVPLYYLNKGEYLVFAYYTGESVDIATESDAAKPVEGFKINVEKYGEITDVIINEDAYKDITFNTSFVILKDKNGNDVIGDYNYYTVIFSTGKKIECFNRFNLVCNGDFVNGENTVTAIFGFFKKELILTGYYITYFIKNIEIINPPVAYEIYRGAYVCDNPFDNIRYKVTFTDGTTKECGSSVILPNGEKVYINASINDEAEITVYVLNNDYIVDQKLTIEEASFEMNLDYLTKNIKFHFDEIRDDWYFVFIGSWTEFDTALGSQIFYIIGILPNLLSVTAYHIKSVFLEISIFCNYYLKTPVIQPF